MLKDVTHFLCLWF